MEYDYCELRGRIYARYRNQARFAKELGVSNATLSHRLDSIKPFTVDEIEKCVELLEIPENEFYKFFFVDKGGKKLYERFNKNQK